MQGKRRRSIKSAGTDEPTFVTFVHPSQFKSRETRRAVRSYVTKRQHQEARSKHLSTPQTTFENDNGESTESPNKLLQPATAFQFSCTPAERHWSNRAKLQRTRSDDDDNLRRASLSTSSEDMRTIVSYSGRKELVDDASDDLRQDTVQIIEAHMAKTCSPLVWTSLGANEAEAADTEQFVIGLTRKEPALWYARLLFVSEHLAHTGVISKESRDRILQKAIMTMSEALADQVRKNSDALILATEGLALHDYMLGEWELARMHWAAHCRMIEYRGGMEMVSIPRPLRLSIEWTAAIMNMDVATAKAPFTGVPVTQDDIVFNAGILQHVSWWLPALYTNILQ